ncbi:MAG: DUF4440 domain-containing protein [Burkholderiales bacterium]|nr:DUF4440 domain-containing protein [Burkholderiales bacterium]
MRNITALALSILLPIAAGATDLADKGAITPTLYSVRFKQTETDLLAAQAAKDVAAMERILSPLFEVRTQTGDIVTKADWLKRAPVDGVKPTHMVVYEVGPNAIAQFQLVKPGESGGVSVVDVWAQDSGGWRLRVRFESPIH